jgi:hypothetical protein
VKENRLIIVLAALLLLVLGTFSYLLASGRLASNVPFETSIKNLEVQSDSDEAEAIEEDLEDTELEDIDSELSDIDKELTTQDLDE